MCYLPLIPNKYRNFLNLFFIDVITIFEFFALSNQTIPLFLPPFLGQKSVFQVECVVALYPESVKNEEITNFRKCR